MPIDPEIQQILACPICKGELVFAEQHIDCPKCALRFPVDDGMPVMLVEEAKPIAP